MPVKNFLLTLTEKTAKIASQLRLSGTLKLNQSNSALTLKPAPLNDSVTGIYV